MQKGNITLIIVLIAALAALGGAYAFMHQGAEETADAMNSDDAMMEKAQDTMMEGDATMEASGSVMMEKKDPNDPAVSHMVDKSMSIKAEAPFVVHGTLLAGNESPLIEFNETDYAEALKTNKTILLFFYADWCPTCRAEFPRMQEAFNNHTGSEVIGFRVHYNDDATTPAMTALAREHGVAYQHTKVVIKNGTRIRKSPEGWSTQQYADALVSFEAN